MSQSFETLIDRIQERDPRYKPDAYGFVMEALSFTQKKIKSAKHISGEELLQGMKDLLLSKYGPLTINVLEHWGIKTTEDFGNIVFNLVDNEVLSKTDDDNIESFREGYDFKEVFVKGYRKQLASKISRMRTF